MCRQYHAIPTIFFECESGWDATNKVWATSAPNQDHSPQIGWGLDGYPIFGPFSEGGVVPTDLDDCYAHDHEPYGVHYHANFDGEVQAVGVTCSPFPTHDLISYVALPSFDAHRLKTPS